MKELAKFAKLSRIHHCLVLRGGYNATGEFD